MQRLNLNSMPGIIKHDSLSLFKLALQKISDQPQKDLLQQNFDESFAGVLHYFSGLLAEAKAVLKGDHGAAQRLIHLLTSVKQHVPLQRIDVEELHLTARHSELSFISEPELLQLVVGVVRASTNSAEASEMLAGLTYLLMPLMRLEEKFSAVTELFNGNPVPMQMMSQDLGGFFDGPDGPILPGDPNLGGWIPYMRGGILGVSNIPLWKPANHDNDMWRVHRFDTPGHAPWNTICSLEALKKAAEVQANGPQYNIDSITPIDACPGELIVLRGRNFSSGGSVEFESGEIVEDAQWSDTEIRVVIPAGTSAGQIKLNILQQTIVVCGTSIPVNRLGTGILYNGGSPIIYSVTVNGSPLQVLKPNSVTPVEIVTSTTAGTTVMVDLFISGSLRFTANPMSGGFNIVQVRTPANVPGPVSGELVVTVTSRCGIVTVRYPVGIAFPPLVAISFIEVTQGVQTSLAQQNQVPPYVMPTVAWKDTAVRIHCDVFRPGSNSHEVNVSGKLIVDTVNQIAPRNPGLTATVKTNSDAAVTDSTLNFIIPAGMLAPALHKLEVTIIINEPGSHYTVTKTIFWEWIDKAPMPVRFFYLDIQSNINRATMQTYARDVLDLIPTPLSRIYIDTRQTFISSNYDLRNKDGWDDLLDALDDMRDDENEQYGIHWLGIVPYDPGNTGSTAGVAKPTVFRDTSDTAIAYANQPESGAHELGHTYGLGHINDPGLGNLNQKPPYDDLDNHGFTRRPSFDVRKIRANPKERDLMGLYDPQHFGLTNWPRLVKMQF